MTLTGLHSTPAAAQIGSTVDGAQIVPVLPGTIRGVVLDVGGTPVSGAAVTLTTGSSGVRQTTTAADDGSFSFLGVPAGEFTVLVTEQGLSDETRSGTLKVDETVTLDTIMMRVASVQLSMTVLPPDEVARIEVHEEEKQRIGEVIPNFYVVYDHDAPPLTTRLKYQLAWKNIIDPVSIGLVAANAAVEQADGAFSGFGPGPAGYGKRVGAGLADLTIGSFLTGAIGPQIFRQDPRYFYKGTGTVWQRTGYALTRSVVCKGDRSGKWQPCYSNVLGGLAAGGISNLYYPASNRNGVGLTFENSGVGLGIAALGNVAQEFLLKHLTPKKHNHGTDQP